MNRLQIVGRLTADPELRATNSGIQLCTFTVAVNRRANREEADFIPVTVWRESAVNCEKYLNKGSQVGVCGSIELRRYENKDGVKMTSANLQADEVEFLSTSRENNNTASKPKSNVANLKNVSDDDISSMPF